MTIFDFGKRDDMRVQWTDNLNNLYWSHYSEKEAVIHLKFLIACGNIACGNIKSVQIMQDRDMLVYWHWEKS